VRGGEERGEEIGKAGNGGRALAGMKKDDIIYDEKAQR